MDKTKADFSGYVTKAGLKCSDGRTIRPEAFKHMNGLEVPLVWSHGHGSPENVLGKMFLEHRDDGVYGYGFFNDTPTGQNAKKLVEHGDIKCLSIYANQLLQKAKEVFHGIIREASLVIGGANPGALIDFVAIKHGDEITQLEDEAVIFTGLELVHGDGSQNNGKPEGSGETVEHAAGKLAADVYETLDEEQRELVHSLVGNALISASVEHSATGPEGSPTKEGKEVKHNVFENQGKGGEEEGLVLSHDALQSIQHSAETQFGGSYKAALEAHALAHGITNIDLLFPEAKLVEGTPEWVKRQTEWVVGVLSGVRKLPFAKIRTRSADITGEQARALGYIKGNLKKEEFFSLAQRKTGPTTIYKKQKLDRDDMIDITDFDVVSWLKAEMRLMLEEEIARAILIGDGRPALIGDDPNPDKIKDPMGAAEGDGIRSIVNDHELYAHKVEVALAAAGGDYNILAEELLRQRKNYKGQGNPTLYTTNHYMVEMLLSKDKDENRRWKTKQELAAALMVKDIVEIEVMEGQQVGGNDLIGIITNLNDYATGTNAGGQVSLFDDFDIDYNQYKYLIETRLSGALVKLKSALVVTRVDPPVAP